MAGEPVCSEISESYNFTYGVPQCSCLGPLLFLIYCNDLTTVLESLKGIQFTDDTTIYHSHSNLRYLKWTIEHELRKLMDWFRANKITLNLSKSVLMLFHSGKKPVSMKLELDNISIPVASRTKFLGIWIDSKLKWNEHVNQLILKLKRNQHLLKKGKNMLNMHAKKIVYFSHIQSHVTYCLSIWGNLLNRSQLDRIRKEQLK